MIPNEVIDQIRESDLVSILKDEGLELKREGANYKCCCPFHNEKTPSFVVSPTRNTAHCFGSCGKNWDAIGFIQDYRHMTFSEAVEYLCDRLHIQYEHREPTPEEREEQFHRESLMNINKAAQEYFQECLKRSPAAQDYCRRRGWHEETLSLFGVGFAPDSWDGLLGALTAKGWKESALLDAGLVKRSESTGKLYDVFRGRVMFPIYARTGYIAGFTGRYIGEKEDVAKYMNTPETALFHKSSSLFGWFQAARQVSTTGTVILCEGNPDVMRLHQIGAQTAVAPCGTALTDEQVALLAKKARKVILIEDMDDAGLAARAKHGEQLLRAGMDVQVMTWERAAGKDPDEYFGKHPKEFDEALSRNTADYVPWLLDREMDGKPALSDQTPVIRRVSGLLACYRDKEVARALLDAFAKRYKGTLRIWNKEYTEACNAMERREVAKDTKMQDMMAEYGFYIKHNCYYGAGSNSKDRPWSNFILEPILHIRDEKNAKRIFRIVNSKGQDAVVKFSQSELVGFADFKTRVETAGNYVWEATANELTQLKKFLYDGTPSADEIRQLGWQKRFGFYAWGNGGLTECGEFVKADNFGIIDIAGNRYYLPGCAADTMANTSGYQLDRKFTYAVSNDISLRKYSEMLIRSFGDHAKIALCFLLATLFKDVVTGVTTSFPMLNLFGLKGTGKSELGHSLTSFFVTGYKAPNITNSTKAALAEAVAEVSNAIVHIDELKRDIDPEKIEFLKGLWDGAGRSRLNIDNDKKRELTAVDSGVVVSGQERPDADNALLSRVIILEFFKTEFSDDEKRWYDELKRVERRGLQHLTGEILRHRSRFVGKFREAWDAATYDLNEQVRAYGIEDRTLNNWATVLAAFRALEGCIDVPFDYQDILRLCADGVVHQNSIVKTSNELSGFWATVENMVTSSKIWIEADYRVIKGGRPFQVKMGEKVTTIEPSAAHRFLFINFNRISALYARESKAGGVNTIPKETLRYYLEKSAEYRGVRRSMRFKLVENQQGYSPKNPMDAKSFTTTAMVFDYDALITHYGISLDVADGYFSQEDEQVAVDLGLVSPQIQDTEIPLF